MSEQITYHGVTETSALDGQAGGRDGDRGHTAVLADWLAGTGRDDAAQTSEPSPPASGSADPAPPPSGYRAALSAAVTRLNAASLSFVMGTGIVSTALYVNGAGTASALLLWVALAGFAVLVPSYGWWMLRRRRRFVATLLG